MRRKGDLPVKICMHCDRPMVWRKKWAKTWDEVKFCSDRCRRDAKTKKETDKETCSSAMG